MYSLTKIQGIPSNGLGGVAITNFLLLRTSKGQNSAIKPLGEKRQICCHFFSYVKQMDQMSQNLEQKWQKNLINHQKGA